MIRWLAPLLLLLWCAPVLACSNPTSIKDGVNVSQNFNTTVDGSGNCVGFQAIPGIALTTGTGWTSATGSNATQAVMTSGGAPALIVQLDQTSTISGGAVTFEGTFDGSNWVSIPVAQLLNPNTFANLTNPYTLVASTNQPFLILPNGYQSVRIKLSTVITGSATVTPYFALLAHNPTIGGIINPLAAGSSVIGKVGIDQTTPGTTNLVYTSADPCSYSAKTNVPISFQTTTLTQQIAASGSNKIYLCSLSLVASAATVFSISGGTGSNCASAQLGILGVAGSATHGLSLPANGGLTLGNGTGTIAVTAASSEICLVQSGAGDLSGNMTYVYAP